MTRTMVILNDKMEGVQMFQFEDKSLFKVGDVIEHDRLVGNHIVKFTDAATVQVLPLIE